MLDAALELASRGFQIFPIHEPSSDVGVCSCGDVHCANPAKHPRPSKGTQAATDNRQQIERWWKAWPKANIGILTGTPSGLVVMDIAANALERFADIEANHGMMPSTLESITGTGGRHVYFATHSGFRPPPDLLGSGITLHSDGSYVVAPPSVHISLNKYVWAEGSTPLTKLALIPNWVVETDTQRIQSLLIEAHQTIPVVTGLSHPDFDEAVKLYNTHNMLRVAPWLPFPKTPGPCPMCPGTNTFRGISPDTWQCIHPQHRGGNRDGNYWTGDVLDIDATQRGRTRPKHLELEGYCSKVIQLEARQKVAAARAEAVKASIGNAVPKPNTGKLGKEIPLTISLASMVAILTDPTLSRPVLHGRKLEYDEFASKHVIDREPYDNDDISELMINTEVNHFSKGAGLTFSSEMMERALQRVCRNNTYHPVREYLDGLKWDEVSRLEDVPKDILNAENSAINRAWFKRWMISAVARIYDPGCQVDHMLVLINKEGGEGKSTFFRILGGDWYAASVINIDDDRRASQAVQGVWIYEWPEMEALARAREAAPVNGFISRREDHYLPPFGRQWTDKPRQCVFGGTTNRMELLRDRGGRRRFLPIYVNQIDLEAARRLRDAFWAEAVALYRKGEQWHPTADEKTLATDPQDKFSIPDDLGDVILGWLDEHDEDRWEETENGTVKKTVTVPAKDITSIPEIMEHCLKIPASSGRWTQAELMRVRKILVEHGWEQGPGRARPRPWVRSEPNT